MLEPGGQVTAHRSAERAREVGRSDVEIGQQAAEQGPERSLLAEFNPGGRVIGRDDSDDPSGGDDIGDERVAADAFTQVRQGDRLREPGPIP